MKTISVRTVTEKIREAFLDKGVHICENYLKIMENALEKEESAARFALDVMLKNARVAEKTSSPVCQDTGMAVVFLTIGQDVRFTDGFIGDAVNEGVRQAYKDGYFRKSVLDPLTRKNTLDNTPAVIHYEIVEGEVFRADIMLKGFGSENMSRLYMLSPSEGKDGVERVIAETAINAGGNPCPPVLLGVGIGGTMEKACLMSKKVLMRDGDNPDEELRDMEKRLTDVINASGTGPQGFGGKLSCLGVKIEKYPTHLAGLPVAVTVQCHAVRHAHFEL